MKTGIIVDNSLNNWPIEQDIRYTQLAEALGFDSLWISDHPASMDPFLALHSIALSTTSVSLGTGTINPYARNPAVLASSAATLSRLTGRSIVLGIGSSFPIFLNPIGLERKLPVEACRDSVNIIKRLLSGESVNYSGKIFSAKEWKLVAPPTTHIPVIVGAQGERMLRMSGEVADGIIIPAGNYAFYKYAIGMFSNRLTEVGRRRRNVEIVTNVNFALSDNKREAISHIKRLVADAIAHRSGPALKVMGFDEEEAHKIGENPDQLSDQFVEEAAICGSVDDCIDRVKRLAELGIDHIVLRFHPENSIRKFGEHIIPKLKMMA